MGDGPGSEDWENYDPANERPVFRSRDQVSANERPVFRSRDQASANESSDAAGARRRSWRRRNFSSLEGRSWDQAKQEAKQTISKGIRLDLLLYFLSC